MPNWDWQTLIALGIVAGTVWLTYRKLRGWWRGGGKSGCASCPSSSEGTSSVKRRPLVQLEAPPRRPES